MTAVLWIFAIIGATVTIWITYVLFTPEPAPDDEDDEPKPEPVDIDPF